MSFKNRIIFNSDMNVLDFILGRMDKITLHGQASNRKTSIHFLVSLFVFTFFFTQWRMIDIDFFITTIAMSVSLNHTTLLASPPMT